MHNISLQTDIRIPIRIFDLNNEVITNLFVQCLIIKRDNVL